MGKEWRRIRRICQYYHSQEWPDTHNPQSAKKKISSFFHDSLALLFVSYWQMGKALPFFKNFATGGHSYVFDHHMFVSVCHFFSSSSLLLPLSVNVFILSRWLYWHYHNESQPRGEPRLLKIIVAPRKKTECCEKYQKWTTSHSRLKKWIFISEWSINVFLESLSGGLSLMTWKRAPNTNRSDPHLHQNGLFGAFCFAVRHIFVFNSLLCFYRTQVRS